MLLYPQELLPLFLEWQLVLAAESLLAQSLHHQCDRECLSLDMSQVSLYR
jgi:hypothetical protein